MADQAAPAGPRAEADESLDITSAVCPLTFVKIKAALDSMEIGQKLSIRMSDGEPVQNIPRSLKDEGQKVLGLADNKDGTYNLLVLKQSD